MSAEDKANETESKIPIWENRKTCWVSRNRQTTPAWKKERIGRVRASLISEMCERVNRGPKIKSRTPEELARIICGLEPESTTPEHELAMLDGIAGEPIVREWYSKEIIKRPIKEVGLAVWKQDPNFSASLDGETKTENDEDAAIEIKIPEKLNEKFINVYESWGKGLNNPHPESYLFPSHYDQITAGSVITGKSGCYYIAACLRSKTCFHQYINTDYGLWNNV